MRPRRLRAVERTGEVHPQVALPQLRGLLVELRDVVERARVVHEDVDRANSSTVRATAASTSVRSVTSQRTASALLPHALDVPHRLLGVDEALLARNRRERPVLVGLLGELRLHEQVGDDDVGARARERQCVGPAETSGPAGDERYAAREVDLNRHAARRFPSRSRAAGSARCPRRSGTASRRASASRPGTP